MPRKRKIVFKLSPASIARAAHDLEAYIVEMRQKNAEFVKRLCDLGYTVIENNMVITGDADTTHDTVIHLYGFGEVSRGRVSVSGTDVLFIEFGAGAHYNGPAGQSPHPKGEKLGYTIGSYGKGQGANDGWFYWDSGSGWLTYSQGTKAAMPMYKASRAIRKQLRYIAKQVFDR